MNSGFLDVCSVREKLRYMIDKGLVTLEHLDEPPPGFKFNMNVHPREFPSGYCGVQYKNLLRDS